LVPAAQQAGAGTNGRKFIEMFVKYELKEGQSEESGKSRRKSGGG